MSLVREIQAAALDSAVDLADLLRKCKVLAAKLQHKEFAAWVSHELGGYDDVVALPKYRRLDTQSRGHFVGSFGRQFHALIAISALPKEFHSIAEEQEFRQPVSALVELLSASEGDLKGPWPADIVAHCQREPPMYPGMVLFSAHRVVPRASIRAALDAVRTGILDFVLAIEEEAPDAGETAPGAPPPVSGERVTHIFNTAVYGGQAVVGTTGGSAQVSAGSITFSARVSPADAEEVNRLIEVLRAEVQRLGDADRDDAVDALAKVEKQLSAPKPDFSRTKQYLDLLASIATAAAPTVDVLSKIVEKLFGRP